MKKKLSRLGRGKSGEYYFSYNSKSLSFPRSIFHSAKIKKVIDLALKLPPGSRILDAGIGAGYVTKDLSEIHKLTGVDIENEAIEYCKKNIKGEFITADLAKLPFKNNFFDLIVFTNTIEHLENSTPALKELRRVLKPNHQMVVSTENCDSKLWVMLENTWYRVFGGPCKPYLHEVHPQRYTPKLLRKDLGKYFKKVEIKAEMMGMELIATASK